MEELLTGLWESANIDSHLRTGTYIGCDRVDDEMLEPGTDEELIAKVIVYLDQIK